MTPPDLVHERAVLARLVQELGGVRHVASLLGVHHNTVYLWINGKNTPSLAQVRAVLDMAGERWRVLEGREQE